MKKCIISLLSIGTLYASLVLGCRDTTTTIVPRSVATNVGRDLLLWQYRIFERVDQENSCEIIGVVECYKSFRPERLIQTFFGDMTLGCSDVLKISGSQSIRNPTDWLADYFLLPVDFQSHVYFRPRITTGLVDIIGLWYSSIGSLPVYIMINLPIAHTRFDLNMQEQIEQAGTIGYSPGYVTPQAIDRSSLYQSFTEFSTGTPLPISNTRYTPLAYSQMQPRSHHLTALAAIIASMGIIICDNHMFSLAVNAMVSAPTGSKLAGQYLFEAIAGNGHHWELGIGANGAIHLWQNCACEESADIIIGANFTHLCTTHQRRAFDLKGKTNSRYMLATYYTVPIKDHLSGLVNGEFITPQAQFYSQLTPVANLSTCNVKVSATAQFDAAALLMYTKYDTSWFFGYGFWARTCEHITKNTCCRLDTEPYWALKGDAYMWGYENNGLTSVAIPLSATQSNATIFYGKDGTRTGLTTPAEIEVSQTNPNIDHPAPAYSDSGNTGISIADTSQPGGTNGIATSIEPVFLSTADIELESGRSYGGSHKIIGQLNHVWYPDCICSEVTLAFGAIVEFGQSAGRRAPNKIEPSINGALSGWSSWISIGGYFE